MIRGLLIALGVAVGVWLVLIVALALAGRRTHAKELAALLPNLLRLFRGLVSDRRVPRRTGDGGPDVSVFSRRAWGRAGGV